MLTSDDGYADTESQRVLDGDLGEVLLPHARTVREAIPDGLERAFVILCKYERFFDRCVSV